MNFKLVIFFVALTLHVNINEFSEFQILFVIFAILQFLSAAPVKNRDELSPKLQKVSRQIKESLVGQG
jgi:hypothetical protein